MKVIRASISTANQGRGEERWNIHNSTPPKWPFLRVAVRVQCIDASHRLAIVPLAVVRSGEAAPMRTDDVPHCGWREANQSVRTPVYAAEGPR